MIKSAWPVSSQFFGNKFLSDLFSQIFWRQRIKQPNKGKKKKSQKMNFFCLSQSTIRCLLLKESSFPQKPNQKGGEMAIPHERQLLDHNWNNQKKRFWKHQPVNYETAYKPNNQIPNLKQKNLTPVNPNQSVAIKISPFYQISQKNIKKKKNFCNPHQIATGDEDERSETWHLPWRRSVLLLSLVRLLLPDFLFLFKY